VMKNKKEECSTDDFEKRVQVSSLSSSSRTSSHTSPRPLVMSLTELVLTSTPSASPLPLTSLHNPSTGQLLFSFKSPPQPSTTISTKGKEPESQLGGGETTCFVQGGNGVGGVLFGLGGKDGRAMLNVWNFTRVSLSLTPPTSLFDVQRERTMRANTRMRSM